MRGPHELDFGSSKVRLPVRFVPLPAKIRAPGMPPAPGLGVFGSNVEYWSELSVRAN